MYYIRRDYPPVRAVELVNVTDHPSIVVDPDGFEPARVACVEPGTVAAVEVTTPVHRGSILLLDPDGRPIRVLAKAEFAREYCELRLPDHPPVEASPEG